MIKINVKSKKNIYPIYIGNDLIKDSNLFKKYITNTLVFVITNNTINQLYGKIFKLTLLSFNKKINFLVLPDGESNKNLYILNKIFDFLIKLHANRNSILIAFGGGVIGDLTGFAASCYMRGISFIQVPTTLLSQVDSSIGGKTGINHIYGKNMIGSFHQPSVVIIDICLLKTLPFRQLISGIAEVIKASVIFDYIFFMFIKRNVKKIINYKLSILKEIVKRSCKIKVDIVRKDENEKNIRSYLNFGHTFAHAIEVISGYGEFLHGEAVGYGMVMASKLSVKLGYLKNESKCELLNLIKLFFLPIKIKFNKLNLIKIMYLDKKNNDNKIKFILMKDFGNVFICYVPEYLIFKKKYKLIKKKYLD